ncbi:MAG TPA: DUF3048 domain-containing protein, partial [Firmicutes bacterium]|nr:DUF3048 domain-containing protein [Bacillota bacterium]
MSGSFSYLDNLLKAESFGDLLVRLFYLKKIFQRDAGLVDSVRQEQAALLERQAIISAHNEKLQSLKYEAEAEYQNLLDKRKSKEVLLAEARDRLAEELERIFPQSERKPVYGVVIDNIQQARPQSGLARASVVYEYEVEGKITRYLALFADFPTKVGPIRSGRVQNVTLALEND